MATAFKTSLFETFPPAMTSLDQLPQDPVFIVGPPRSGTTYLQSLLACLDGVYSFSETHFFTTLRGLKLGGDLSRPLDTPVLAQLASEVSAMAGIEGLRPQEMSGQSAKACFECVVRRLLEEHNEMPSGAGWRWVEKTPGHVFHLDSIAGTYPNARFLGIFRDPVQSVISRKTKIPEDSGKSVRELARAWARARHAMNRFSMQNPGRLFQIRYEALVDDPEGTMEELCSFLGLTFDPMCLGRADALYSRLSRPHEKWKVFTPQPEQDASTCRKVRQAVWTLMIERTLTECADSCEYAQRFPRSVAMLGRLRDVYRSVVVK
jgi:hypothetical protein